MSSGVLGKRGDTREERCELPCPFDLPLAVKTTERALHASTARTLFLFSATLPLYIFSCPFYIVPASLQFPFSPPHGAPADKVLDGAVAVVYEIEHALRRRLASVAVVEQRLEEVDDGGLVVLLRVGGGGAGCEAAWQYRHASSSARDGSEAYHHVRRHGAVLGVVHLLQQRLDVRTPHLHLNQLVDENVELQGRARGEAVEHTAAAAAREGAAASHLVKADEGFFHKLVCLRAGIDVRLAVGVRGCG